MNEVCFEGPADKYGSEIVPPVDLEVDPPEPLDVRQSDDTAFMITAYDTLGDEVPDGADTQEEPAGEGADLDPAASEPPAEANNLDPPTDIPTQETTGEEEPDRAAALRQLVDLITTPPADRALKKLLEEGMDYDEAVMMVEQSRRDGPLRQEKRVSKEQLEAARTEQRDAMEATGLRVDRRLTSEGGMLLAMQDPEAFTATLQALRPPETQEDEEHLHDQLTHIVRDALSESSMVVVCSNHDDVTRIRGTTAFEQLYIDALGPISDVEVDNVPAETRRLAADLPGQAATIASELERLGAPQHTIESMRQLAIAHREGLGIAWATGHTLRLLGHSDTTLTVDRLSGYIQWEDNVYRYLRYLRYEAPVRDSDFAQEVRSTVIRDLQVALDKEENITNKSWLRTTLRTVNQIIPPR